jgi:hypothetical protein
MPRWARESAVMFSRKWILALEEVEVFVFSTIATEVSSLVNGDRVSLSYSGV